MHSVSAVKKPAFAPRTPDFAPKRLERGLRLSIRKVLTSPYPSKIGFLDQLILEDRATLSRQAKIAGQARIFQELVSQLVQAAAEQQLTERQLLSKVRISCGTWHRILDARHSTLDPRRSARWLPTLEAALARLKPS